MAAMSSEQRPINGCGRALAAELLNADAVLHLQDPSGTPFAPSKQDNDEVPATLGVAAPVSATPLSNAAAIPGSTPAEPEGVRTLEAELAEAARRSWPQLPAADVDAAVDAGMLSAAMEAAAENAPGTLGVDNPSPSGGAAHRATAEVAAAAAIQRHGLPPDATAPVDWSEFGTVIPVLAGSPGAGASTLVTVMADALQLERLRVLVIDPSDPRRSGLADAARSDGPWLIRPHSRVHIRFSWRAQALLARLETRLAVVSPGMVPPPQFWRPPVPPHATVVDLGHDPWRVTAHPLVGAGAWLRRGTPQPHPVLVVRASRPGLLHAEQVLSRLDPWINSAAACPPAQLVVMGVKRWPDGVAGAAGRRLAALLPDAVFVPHDPEFAAAGVTPSVTPTRLREAIAPVLRRWGLMPASARTSRWTMSRRRR